MSFGKVIGTIFGFIWLILDGLRKVLHLLLLLLLLAIVCAALQTSVPVVPDSAALVLNPQGTIVEQLSGDPFERALARASSPIARETQLRDILDALHSAATDKRIKLLVLDLQHLEGAGLSKLQEIAAALDRFRASGKKVIAINDYYDQTDYYLAAHADEIDLDPLGGVVIEGYARYNLYFKDALEKLGVDVNVFKVGSHKSAMEPFTRTDMSAQEREQSLAYLNAFWSAYQADVTAARKLPPDALAQYVSNAVPLLRGARGNAAQVALNSKLVTAIKTREQLNIELQQAVGKDDSTHLFKSIELDAYVTALHAERVIKPHSGKQIGIIVAAGEILDGAQPPGRVGGESLARAIREARDDRDVKAVVLRIDSPGGSMLASEQIYRELDALRKSGKPVITSMSSVAASGGYYIAMGTDEVWASPTTITGSIGVFAVIPTFQNTLRKLGIASDGVGTTGLSGAMQLERPLSPQVKALLQASVDYAYSSFLERVASNRDTTPEAVDQVAQGRVWAGSAAKEHGLVDNLGNLQAAVDAAAARAKLGPDYKITYLEPQLSWQESLGLQMRATLGRLAGAVGLGRFFERNPAVLVHKISDPLVRESQLWTRMNDPRGLYSYCFCTEH